MVLCPTGCGSYVLEAEWEAFRHFGKFRVTAFLHCQSLRESNELRAMVRKFAMGGS
jgi:hypothetical protein